MAPPLSKPSQDVKLESYFSLFKNSNKYSNLEKLLLSLPLKKCMYLVSLCHLVFNILGGHQLVNLNFAIYSWFASSLPFLTHRTQTVLAVFVGYHPVSEKEFCPQVRVPVGFESKCQLSVRSHVWVKNNTLLLIAWCSAFWGSGQIHKRGNKISSTKH